MTRLLVIDDSDAFRYALAVRLRADGFTVDEAGTVAEALTQVAIVEPDLAVVDAGLPDGSGADLIKQFASLSSGPVPSMIVTSFGSIDEAVDAMRDGCVDYVTKERNLDEIAHRVRMATETVKLQRRITRLERAAARRHRRSAIYGESAAIDEVRAQICEAASATDTTVLIEGETGTGKELVAAEIHQLSERARGAYITIDCTTLTSSLFESELFGHERGAFTGADRPKEGLVEIAGGGTLLLDEIGELEIAHQAKLLRVLQERTFRRVGSVRNRDIDVRFIASTNRSLKAEVAESRFRADLYYRLRVLKIRVPPLRDREDDIVLLARHFLGELGRRLGKSDLELSAGAEVLLAAHRFPGNVRELRGMVEQAVVRARTKVISSDLLRGALSSFPPPPTTSRAGRPSTPVDSNEALRIREVMEECDGNQSKAAAMLGISRFALKRKLVKLHEARTR